MYPPALGPLTGVKVFVFIPGGATELGLSFFFVLIGLEFAPNASEVLPPPISA